MIQEEDQEQDANVGEQPAGEVEVHLAATASKSSGAPVLPIDKSQLSAEQVRQQREEHSKRTLSK